MVERKIAYKDKTFRIIVVYNQDTKGTWKEIEERVDGREEEVMIVGGDWNARTGEEGGQVNEDIEKEKDRRSKDKKINAEGRTLLRYERGWTIINGRDEEGEEWAYIGERGNSVIDYVIGKQEATEEIFDVKVGKRTESDHMPLEVEIGGPELQNPKKGKKKRKREGSGQGKHGKIPGGMQRLDLRGENSRGVVDRNQKQGKQSDTKEESKDKKMGHGRESVV
ncbi:uncharacterized protein LOC122577561 [Bombus pyrosoma]|uniref:uncharacterized protein LOC122577561 n=1 Tax=Bombus pyrosoma TaxID=396416 RepID=UPI001CB92A2B|nr:uncharacterized protein LOC122577561 [Bombus pyrosoma]